ALQYAPDDETPLQVLWRFAKLATASAGATSRVSSLDPEELVKSIQSLQRIGAEVMGAISTGIEVVETLRVGAGGVTRASETKFDFMKKRSWYLALQGTALFIQQGRLSDFKLVVSQAPCRHSTNFQWGICRQLGEIAVDPLWDTLVRQQAVDFLGELYRSVTFWKPHVDVKQWIITILVQISDLTDVSLKDRALALLTDLKKDGTAEFPCRYSLGRRLPLPTASPLLAQVHEIPRVDHDLNVLRLFRIADFKQPVYIAPMAKPSLQAPDDTLFPLMEKVKDFLAGDGHVMLILGDSGAGKSTFNRQLEHELWQDYKPGDRIPLFINLPTLERPEKDLVAEHLKLHNFLDDQIRELKLQHQFTLICDGYDESQLKTNLHHTNSLNQFGQWKTKLLITCRTQYLGPDYRSRFAPMALNRCTGVADHLFQQAVIAPFTMEQIENYVDRYILLEPRAWVQKDYMDKMKTIPNLMNLVKNPFLLTLCLEALPSVVEGKSNLSRLRVTRVHLYDTFVQHWLGVNKRRLLDQMQVLSSDNQSAFDALVEDGGFEDNGIMFQQDLAAAIFQEQDGKPIVVYVQRRDGTSWKAPFFSSDPEISLLRSACLLSRAGTRHRFVHRSILEYFYSCTIISGSADSNDEFAPHYQVDSSNIGDHPLSQRNLVAEPSIIQFLAERVQPNPGFKQQLLAFIEQSKTDDRSACAAANAITILVKAGVSFNGADLRGIRVPGADLSDGEFDAAQLQEADLTGANFTRCWIRHADFSKARMEEVKFGELPHLEEAERVMSIAYSLDGEFFALGLDLGNINIYNTTNWTKNRTLEGHSKRVSSIAYSPSGEQLLSGCFDNTVRLWSCKTGSTEFILEGHTNKVKAVAFSPSGNQVASASDDKTVRLWDTRTGSILFVLDGYTDSVLTIAYSPDGRHIVSGSDDSRIRTFDTHTGQMDWALERTAAVRCVDYSPDGLRIVAGDDEGYMLLWEPTTSKSVERRKDDNAGFYAVGFSPNGQWIASSSHDYTVMLWEAQSLIPVSIFTGHSGHIESVKFSPNSQQVASGCWDYTVRLWDVTTTGAGLNLVANQSDQLKNMAYFLDGRNLVALGCSGTMRQYDVATGDSGISYICDPGADTLVLSPDGRRIAAYGCDKAIYTWDADTGADLHVIQGHTRIIFALAYSPDSQWLASGSRDTTVRLWNACSGAPGLVLSGHKDPVVTVAFSPCGLEVVSGSEDGTIRVWNVGTGESRVAVDTGASIRFASFRYSPIGMQIAFQRHGSNGVELWHEGSLEALHNLQHDDDVRNILFSPHGQWIAINCDGSIWLWKLVVRDATQDWELALVIRDLLSVSFCIGWRPDTLEFVTGGLTGSVQVWKLVETPDGGWCARLMWSRGRTALTATNAIIANAVGLGATNHKLLKQGGARDGPLPDAESSDKH
ncbi:WD_REPEATS_REGION domain-containing protein, partial [Linnemannia gamsii]